MMAGGFHPVPLLVTLGILLLLYGMAWLVRGTRREARVTLRLRAVCGAQVKSAPVQAGPALLHLLGRVGVAVVQSGFLPRKTILDLEGTLLASGYRASSALPVFVGAKVFLVLLLPALVWATATFLGLRMPPPLIAAAAAGILGLMLPDVVIRQMRKRYLGQVEKGFADALDLLIICAEAGLPLEAGIDRVALDFRDGNRPTASEFELLGQEMKILPDRRQALTNAGTRTGLDAVIRLGATLSQSMQYGTPLAQALRTLAAESRATMLNRFEARAARLPVLLTMPMIVFILPCVFLVVGAPAIVQVFASFKPH